MKKKSYLALINANKQMQSEGKDVPDLWVIFAAGNSIKDTELNSQLRRTWMTPDKITIIEDTPEERAKYGNPRAV
jgi:hypothetical protein